MADILRSGMLEASGAILLMTAASAILIAALVKLGLFRDEDRPLPNLPKKEARTFATGLPRLGGR